MTAEQLTFPTASSVCELVFGDPLHQRERTAVIDAIVADARAHGREVDPNRVRPTVPQWVNPRVTSAVYNALGTRRLLVFKRWATNDDRRGRNVGKPQRIYEWTGEL